MKKIQSILTLLFLLNVGVFAQDIHWAKKPNRNSDDTTGYYTSFSLNNDALKGTLRKSNKNTTLGLPMPDGSIIQFTISPSTVLSPELAAKFPHIKTFNGISKDGKIKAKLDFNGSLLYGLINSPEGLVYIDPIDPKNISDYKSYFVKNYKDKVEAPVFIESDIVKGENQVKILRKKEKTKQRINTTSGGVLKKYRLAMAADNEYSSFHGNTTSSVLSAIVTTVNRVNSVYENDLSITFELIGDNDKIIFTNPTTDPFRGLSDPEDFLSINVGVLNDSIGNSNFDIGHVFSTGSGGVAGFGVVCNNSRKAEGTTGVNSPVGDAFDIDFVAHEIGHQFRANHTFNGSQGSCVGGNRNASTAFEPGSGSSIMAYAGICAGDNIQNNSDPNFHAISLDEIVNYTTTGTGSNCPTTTAISNATPTVTVDKTVYTIPINTPFQLTAIGNDAEGNGNLTYSWEQIDAGPAGAPNNPTGNAAMFRVFSPTESPTRFFPRLQSILSNTTVSGENYPTTTRDLNFRVVVRDNDSRGGAIVTDDILIKSNESFGPFTVTSLNDANTSLTGGSVQNISWDVSNTDEGDINVKNVRILLSTDGGNIFNTVLTESTENDGLAQVLFPDVVASSARIKIEAIGNVFFDLNDTDFEIVEAASPDFSIRVNPIPLIVCTPDNAEFEVFVDGVGGFSEMVTLTLDGLSSELNASFDNNTLLSGQSTKLTITNTSAATQSANDFKILGNSSSITGKNQDVALSIISGSTTTVAIISPENNIRNVEPSPTFQWEASEIADSYTFQLATDSNFDNIVLENNSVIEATLALGFVLEEGVTYFWRVAINNQCGTGDFTTSSFVTASFVRNPFSLNDLNIDISNTGTPIITSTLTITDDLIIGDLNIIGLDVNHTWIEDLTISITSPSGKELVLIDAICSGREDLLTNLDDEAVSANLPCPPTDNEFYKPQNPLSLFKGESAKGDWVLRIIDTADLDGGTLNGWGIDIGVESIPISLLTSSINSEEVLLSWEIENSSFDDLTGFQIEAKTSSETSFVNIGEVGANASSFNANDLEGETNYEFRVRAILSSGFSDYSNVSPFLTVPNSPINLEAIIKATGDIDIFWLDNFETEEGFNLEISTNDIDFELLESLGENVDDFTFSNAETGVSYSFRINTFNRTGNSAYSDTVKVIISSVNEFERELRIFPNPGSEMVQIINEGGKSIRNISLSDLSGKVVPVTWNKNSESNFTVNTANLRNGIYMISLSGENGNATIRWIKK